MIESEKIEEYKRACKVRALNSAYDLITLGGKGIWRDVNALPKKDISFEEWKKIIETQTINNIVSVSPTIDTTDNLIEKAEKIYSWLIKDI